jgi:hypothetical protein
MFKVKRSEAKEPMENVTQKALIILTAHVFYVGGNCHED